MEKEIIVSEMPTENERRSAEDVRNKVAEVTTELQRLATELDELVADPEPDEMGIQTIRIGIMLNEGKLVQSIGHNRKRINEILTEISDGMVNPRAIEMITDRIKSEHLQQY